ncbi:MAG: c-type cytochrome [Flavobacteriales bacterium]
MMENSNLNQTGNKQIDNLVSAIQRLLSLVIILSIVLLLLPFIMVNGDAIKGMFSSGKKPNQTEQNITSATDTEAEANLYWKAPDLNTIADPAQKDLVSYGKELIAHTSKYLGPKGKVAPISNGLNCQNCHLDAGTKVFGNNYGSVASTYPKFRARSGSEEDIYKRVNDCFERSLNGKPLAENSKEMQAIKSYIEFLGTNVPKGQKAEGSGLKDLAFLDRAADPARGKIVYEEKCKSCHMANGEGVKLADGSEYIYPPLWGKHSYNDAAGLYRMSNFAKYVKYNMPLGATHQTPLLSDEEAWDVSAFVNSQPRPSKKFPKDWPDISNKPIDHPFGSFADTFPESQHKYGPFKPIQEYYANKK